MEDFNRILFPVSLTEISPRVAPYVASMAGKYQAQVHLLHVAHGLNMLVDTYIAQPSITDLKTPASNVEKELLADAEKNLIPLRTYKPVDTEILGATQVLEGKADAFVYVLPFNTVFMAMHPEADLVFLDAPFTREPIAWAIRKNDPDFLAFLNAFLAQIKQDRRFDRIYDKWFNRTDWCSHVR